jgi:hypothetical protein
MSKSLMRNVIAAIAAAGLLVVACDDDESGSGSVTLNGQEIDADSFLSWNIISASCGGSVVFPVGVVYAANPILVTTRNTSCGENGCWLTRNTQSLLIVPYEIYVPGTIIDGTLPAGTYTVSATIPSSGRGAIVYYLQTDGSCNVSSGNTVLLSGVQGTVTLTNSPSQSGYGQATGSMDLTLPSNSLGYPSGYLNATFDTSGCAWVNTAPYCLAAFTCGGLFCSDG